MARDRILSFASAFLILSAISLSASSSDIQLKPGKRPGDPVGFADGRSLQVIATPDKGQSVRFHVAITGGGAKVDGVQMSWYLLRNSLLLLKRKQPDGFELYPGTPKLESRHEKDEIFSDFTIPRTLVKDPGLLLGFTVVLSPHPAQNTYWVSLKDFAGDAADGPD